MPRSTEIVGEKTNSTGLIIHRIIAYVVLVLLVVVSLFPFYLLIINATRGRSQAGIRWYPDHFLATNFKNLFSGSTAVAYGSVWRSLANSLFISACASLLSVYFSALTAYATHVYQFKLRKFADMFILIVMMVPTQASAIGFYQFMNKLGWTDTYIPLIIPAVAAPATYYFMKQYMASALPLEIVEAARIDGCGEFKTFNKIVTPILKPAFAVQIIFTFVTNWNNYFMPRLILTSKSKYTIPLVLNAMRYAGPQEKDVGMFSLYIVLAILPVVIVYLCLSKFIIRGVALGRVNTKLQTAYSFSVRCFLLYSFLTSLSYSHKSFVCIPLLLTVISILLTLFPFTPYPLQIILSVISSPQYPSYVICSTKYSLSANSILSLSPTATLLSHCLSRP